jgi:radical SAM protein with 4Fe4S-binding SPASM domain
MKYKGNFGIISNKCMYHYYGSSLLISDYAGYTVVLDEAQTKLFNLLKDHDDFEEAVKEYMYVIDEDELTARCTLEQFLSTLSKHFSLDQSLKANTKNTIGFTGKPGAYYPQNITIALTSVCGQKCKHCMIKDSMYTNSHIDYANLARFLAEIKNKTPNLVLSGGEPLYYENINRLMADFGEIFNIGVITSGYEIRVAKEVLSKISFIQVSLHGANSEEHDSFVQRDGAFKSVTSFIQRRIDEGKDLTVITQAKTTDINQIRRLIEKCISLGVKRVKIGIIVKKGAAKDLAIWGGYDVSAIMYNIRKLTKEYENQIYIEREETCQDRNKNSFFKCGAGSTDWYINTEGNIYPCMLVNTKKFSMGTIADDSFYRAIKDGEYKRLVEENWWKASRESDKLCDRMGGYYHI